MGKLILLWLFIISGYSVAGELIINAEIVEVANTYGGEQDFTVRLEGGTGICSSSPWIIFPESKKQSDASYQQAFSIALAAMTTGKKVRIHNFESDSCYGANFISITR